MSTGAAKVLHFAIEDAVERLEPQLLPLFSGRGAHAQAKPPTMRTQLALKMLVALTRFFPEEHRVRRAGKQLEQIWPPLVHGPRGNASRKLLNYYFRLRQDLLDTPERALRSAMGDVVRAGIEEAEVSGQAPRGLDYERRLSQLASFLPEPCMDATALAALSPLARLFAWQQALQPVGELSAAGADVVDPRLLPDMLTVLDRCTALCRTSDCSLDYFCSTGLARGLWHLRGITQFGSSATIRDLFAELEDECLDIHLAGSTTQSSLMQQWLMRLFTLVQDGTVTRAPQSADSLPDLTLRSVYDQELAKYRRQLQSALQHELQPDPESASEDLATFRVSAPLITVLYKLTWVFAAAGQRDWARFCHCAYRVALQFWRIRGPVTPACHAMLRNLAAEPGAPLPSSVLRNWRQQLLHDWPSWTGDTKRPIALRPEAGHVVTLDAVPDLLSGSFTALVQAGRLTELPSANACLPFFDVLLRDLASQLLQELVLLEKGAAAMKVWPLEQLCTLLIGVYEAHLREEVALPVQLLQSAHRQLVRMLDQAAAWHEVQITDGLVQALEDWLRDAVDTGALCREPLAGVTIGVGSGVEDGADADQALRAQLLSCLGTLAPVLERPVRLQLDAGGVRLDAGRMTQVLDCLRPLIKFLLLDQSIDVSSRNAMHKPRISTLTVTLRAIGNTLGLTAGEDSHEAVVAESELQRLQRRLPKAAGPLACEARAGRGRAFTFTLG